jgi:HD superfamily phosphohydrolase
VSAKVLKINDPIHGFVILPDFIRKIVDSPEVQRLMRIRQLSGTNHVFPGANHTRFEHSLGVAALAQRLIRNLRELHNVEISTDDINDCITSALLHDLGHGPFSHNFESLLMEKGKDHEDFTEWIILQSEIGDTITDLGFDKKYIASISTGRIIGKGHSHGSLISQLLTSAVNVDSMDYLLRDNYHCGTEGRSVDINRLLLSMDPLDNGLLGIDINALISLEGFLLSRISSFRTIYFHKTCRAVQLMLADGMHKIVDDIGLLDYNTPTDYTKWDDYVMWAELIKNPLSHPIMEKIQRRELLKMCFESRIEITDQQINPQEILIALEEKSNIPREHIYIDLPSSPNVPYNHISSTRPNEIYSFQRNPDGSKSQVRLEDHSLFFEQFKGILKLIRIYTWPQYRETLSNAAHQIFKDIFSP